MPIKTPPQPGTWNSRVCREVKERGGTFNEVRKALTAYGVTPADAHARILAACRAGLVRCINPEDYAKRQLMLLDAGRQLAAEDRTSLVRRLHHQIVAGERATLAKVRQIGEELLAEKEACIREGRMWYKFLEGADINPRTALRYMTVAKAYQEGILSDKESDLGHVEALIRISEARESQQGAPVRPGPGKADIPTDGDEGDDLPPTDEPTPTDPKKYLCKFAILITQTVRDEIKKRLAWLTVRLKLNQAEVVVKAIRDLDEGVRRD